MRLHNTIGHLVSTFTGWDGFLKDPNYVRSGSSITWKDPESLFLPEVVTRQHTLDLSARRQFSFRISEDDSLIQIAYRFGDDDSLSEARLAYYEVGDSNGDLLDQSPVVPSETEDNDVLVRWLRIDYSATIPHSVLHPPCHLHLSGHPNTRFAVKGVPTPAQFVELVIASFYPAWYETYRLEVSGNFRNSPEIDRMNSAVTNAGTEPNDLLRRIPHFLTPGF